MDTTEIINEVAYNGELRYILLVPVLAIVYLIVDGIINGIGEE
jgi:hypothetical protein